MYRVDWRVILEMTRGRESVDFIWESNWLSPWRPNHYSQIDQWLWIEKNCCCWLPIFSSGNFSVLHSLFIPPQTPRNYHFHRDKPAHSTTFYKFSLFYVPFLLFYCFSFLIFWLNYKLSLYNWSKFSVSSL